MSEVVVGLTDYLLTIECGLFAGILMRLDSAWPEIRRHFAVFFSSLALTSLAGGTYHVWLSDSSSALADLLWRTTVVALGAVAFGAWAAGATLLFAQPTRTWAIRTALAEFLAYSVYVAAVDDRFLVAIANYIPAAVFLAAAFALAHRRRPAPPVLMGLAGLVVTGIAATIQRSGFSVHPHYFNHNATYHLTQGIGLFLIFLAALYFVRNPLRGARI
ncbi:MAG TPA: hypothetical protein VEF92_03285 [Burkholderiales bacterium]|nr:hypothetical protein [Burkholderiales bacterium]